jgi:hypothetical protein
MILPWFANMLRANQSCLDSIPVSHRLENVASCLQDLPICMYKESAMNPLCCVRGHIWPGLGSFTRGSNKCLCVWQGDGIVLMNFKREYIPWKISPLRVLHLLHVFLQLPLHKIQVQESAYSIRYNCCQTLCSTHLLYHFEIDGCLGIEDGWHKE